MKTWEVFIFCLLVLVIGIDILMLTDIKERIRRKKHAKWYEHYDRAMRNSINAGIVLREKTESITKRKELVMDMYLNDKCSDDEYDEAMKTLNVEYRDITKWLKKNNELLGIEADLRAADAYAKEHNLKWGILY
jgi:hypothetical protein